MRAIVFDFNGTLFWDTDKHNSAWIILSKELRGYELTPNELKTKVQGRTTPDIIKYLIGPDVDEELIRELSYQKEALYRKLCLEDPEGLTLAPGAKEFLNNLRQADVPYAIATSSDKKNVDFYFKVFRLEQWFSWSNIVYDDGTIKGKPAPDIFVRAFEKLNVLPQECAVVEDSSAGIEAARHAQAGRIIIIRGDSLLSGDLDLQVDDVCVDFFELNKLYFKGC